MGVGTRARVGSRVCAGERGEGGGDHMNEERQRQTGSGGRVGGMNGRVRQVIRPSTGTRHDNKRYVSVSWGMNFTYFSC